MASLQLHMKLKSSTKTHECDVCQKVFNNHEVMVVHKRLHFGERPAKCVDCGKRFLCSSYLNNHYQLHKQQNLDHKNEFANSPPFNNRGFGQKCLDLKRCSPLTSGYSTSKFLLNLFAQNTYKWIVFVLVLFYCWYCLVVLCIFFHSLHAFKFGIICIKEVMRKCFTHTVCLKVIDNHL